jgi:hypothetical protein
MFTKGTSGTYSQNSSFYGIKSTLSKNFASDRIAKSEGLGGLYKFFEGCREIFPKKFSDKIAWETEKLFKLSINRDKELSDNRDHRKTGYEDTKWTELAQDRVQWQTLILSVIKLKCDGRCESLLLLTERRGPVGNTAALYLARALGDQLTCPMSLKLSTGK